MGFENLKISRPKVGFLRGKPWEIGRGQPSEESTVKTESGPSTDPTPPSHARHDSQETAISPTQSTPDPMVAVSQESDASLSTADTSEEQQTQIRPTSHFAAVEQNYFKLALKLKLKGALYAIGLFIYRHTVGFNKLSSALSVSFIARGTGYHELSVRRNLRKLEAMRLIRIKQSKKNPWTDPREISINLELIRADSTSEDRSAYHQANSDSATNKMLPVNKMLSDNILSPLNLLSNKDNLTNKNTTPPISPTEKKPDRGGIISEDHKQQAEKILSEYYHARGERKPDPRLRQSGLAWVIEKLAADNYPEEAVRRAVMRAAKQADTKAIQRASVYLGEEDAKYAKELASASVTSEAQSFREKEITEARKERDAIQELRSRLSEEELKKLTNDAAEIIRGENPEMQEFLIPTQAAFRVNALLRERFMSSEA